jgi:SOS-response transcriptional repressor LexA
MPSPNVDVAHLARLRDHYARHGVMPSYAGIGAVVGFRAKTASVKLAQRLAKAGYLKQAPGGKLAPTERFFELPVMEEHVRAGAPEAVAGQMHGDRLTLDSFLIEAPSKTVLFRVRGDSMRDAGILEGDLAVVERAEAARPGEFVVAVCDDEFTLKELRYEGRQAVLVPHNPQFDIIRPARTLQIFGVVRGIVRRYPGASEQVRRVQGALHDHR